VGSLVDLAFPAHLYHAHILWESLMGKEEIIKCS